MLTFWQEKQYCLIDLEVGEYPFNTNDQLLSYDISYQMLLRRMNVIGQPQDADFFKEGENNLYDGFIYALAHNIIIEDIFELIHVEIYHELNQLIDHSFLLGQRIGKGNYFVSQFFRLHLINMGNLVTILIE